MWKIFKNIRLVKIQVVERDVEYDKIHANISIIIVYIFNEHIYVVNV